MNILVSDPDGNGDCGRSVLCDEHLHRALSLNKLGTHEYVIGAHPDAECEECDE